jgi:hypothetical protein
VGRTWVLKGQVANLVWDESFKVYCAHIVVDVQIFIKDDVIVGSIVIDKAKNGRSNNKGTESKMHVMDIFMWSHYLFEKEIMMVHNKCSVEDYHDVDVLNYDYEGSQWKLQ